MFETMFILRDLPEPGLTISLVHFDREDSVPFENITRVSRINVRSTLACTIVYRNETLEHKPFNDCLSRISL